ncbi:MAG: homoserine kinase [Spirulinaceae cyanobacterium]
MTNTYSVTVIVPATTANLGPGFDCLGAALNLYNQFKFTKLDKSSSIPVEIIVKGKEADKVSTNTSNLVYQSFLQLYQHLKKQPPAIQIEISMQVPLARGLGSSATAIIGGLMGANEIAGKALQLSQLRDLAITIEGHPDNVVPALLGNCQLSTKNEQGDWSICQLPWHQDIISVVAIPDFELSTEEARKVLPPQISYTDAIFNISRLGLLIRGFETGKEDWLKVGMADKLHQPYRKSLICGYESVKFAALRAGAYGTVISGAGPTLLSLTNSERAGSVVSAMAEAWETQGIQADVRVLSIDGVGTEIVKTK